MTLGSGEMAPEGSFLQLGAAGESLEVSRVQLWRDVHYLSNGATLLKSGPNEVILLGDNSIVSRDSRNWPKPGVNKSQIIGLVENPAKE